MMRAQVIGRWLVVVMAGLFTVLEQQVGWGEIVGLSSGITVDADANLTGVTVPGGKSFLTPLVTAHSASYLMRIPFTVGEIVDTADPITLMGGTAHNLNLNQSAGRMLLRTGYGYADLTHFGGHPLIAARDADGTQQDFLLTDYGGNDNFGVAALLTDGSAGQRVNIDSTIFGRIQYDDPFTNQPMTQPTGFVAFDVSDLLDGSGTPLAPDAVLRGVRVYENQRPDPTVADGRLDLGLFVADVIGVPEPEALLVGVMLVFLCGATDAHFRIASTRDTRS